MQYTRKLFNNHWPVILVIIAGFAMRITGLTHQSLWLDELHTMNEADPSIGWNELFGHLKCCDQHPPLQFIIARFAFTIFGHTEFVARFISVIVGTFSILAMYWLGRQMLNKRLGLIVAILTCINYYNLFYSQEARCYIFAFLFAALSFLFFVKLVQQPNRKNMIGYGLLTLGLLYSHYYSLFVVIAQAFLALFFILSEKSPARGRLFRLFLLSGAIMVIGYIPILPLLKATTGIKSFWIAEIDHNFLQNYFSDYFGNASVLIPVLVGLLLVYVINVAISGSREIAVPVKDNTLSFSFVILTSWVFITLLIPYIRSVTAFPMLFPRYTIVILPAILLAIAYGIELFGRPLIVAGITALVGILSLVHLQGSRKYYTAVSKTQFREMTAYVMQNNAGNYPILNERTNWHQGYYLKKHRSKAIVLTGKKESIIDSIVTKSSARYDLNGFWIAGAHGDAKPEASVAARLDSGYILLKQKDFYDAWAQLYVAKSHAAGKIHTIDYNGFDGGAVLADEKMVAIWSGSIESKPITLAKGKFIVTIAVKGDPGGGQYPHLNIYIGGKKLADFFVTGNMENMQFVFENSSDDPVVIKIELDNDFAAAGQGDRNAFVGSILIEASN
jgi:mannosyltransferase